MRWFPMFLEMKGRVILLAGGGEQAAQKARLLRRTEARILVMAPELNPELRDLAAADVIEHIAAEFDEAAIRLADYAFIATGDIALDDRIAAAAREGGALVNMVDRPEACDMITPAIVDRDPVVIAIGTEGAAPVLARAIKTDLEQSLSTRLGPFIAALGARRPAVMEKVGQGARLPFWKWAVNGAPWRLWRDGDEAGALALADEAIARGEAPEAEAGGVTFIEIPEAPDLLPLRAVERLQGAARIIHPANIDERILDYARRDAERILLTSCPRDDFGALLEADGPVVILATADCMVPGAERISAAKP